MKLPPEFEAAVTACRDACRIERKLTAKLVALSAEVAKATAIRDEANAVAVKARAEVDRLYGAYLNDDLDDEPAAPAKPSKNA